MELGFRRAGTGLAPRVVAVVLAVLMSVGMIMPTARAASNSVPDAGPEVVVVADEGGEASLAVESPAVVGSPVDWTEPIPLGAESVLGYVGAAALGSGVVLALTPAPARARRNR